MERGGARLEHDLESIEERENDAREHGSARAPTRDDDGGEGDEPSATAHAGLELLLIERERSATEPAE